MDHIIPFRRKRPRRRWRFPRQSSMAIATLVLVAGMAIIAQLTDERANLGSGPTLVCSNPRIIDGDTLACNGKRIRLAGIDAPEMPGHCRPGRECVAGDPHAAANALRVLVSGGISCTPQGTDAYGRTISRCTAQGRDVSCALVASGHAVERYGGVNC